MCTTTPKVYNGCTPWPKSATLSKCSVSVLPVLSEEWVYLLSQVYIHSGKCTMACYPRTLRRKTRALSDVCIQGLVIYYEHVFIMVYFYNSLYTYIYLQIYKHYYRRIFWQNAYCNVIVVMSLNMTHHPQYLGQQTVPSIYLRFSSITTGVQEGVAGDLKIRSILYPECWEGQLSLHWPFQAEQLGTGLLLSTPWLQLPPFADVSPLPDKWLWHPGFQY